MWGQKVHSQTNATEVWASETSISSSGRNSTATSTELDLGQNVALLDFILVVKPSIQGLSNRVLDSSHIATCWPVYKRLCYVFECVWAEYLLSGACLYQHLVRVFLLDGCHAALVRIITDVLFCSTYLGIWQRGWSPIRHVPGTEVYVSGRLRQGVAVAMPELPTREPLIELDGIESHVTAQARDKEMCSGQVARWEDIHSMNVTVACRTRRLFPACRIDMSCS